MITAAKTRWLTTVVVVLATAFVGSSAVAESAQAMPVVGYFTDGNNGVTHPEAAILANGFTPDHVLNINTFDFSTVDILMINESRNGSITNALLNRLDPLDPTGVEAFVRAGGVLVVHDRFVSNGGPAPNPFIVGASAAIPADRAIDGLSSLIDVSAPGGTLVTDGPFGVIDDTSLDGGNFSSHGFVDTADVIAFGGTPILHRDGQPDQTVAFSYLLDAGAVYYSTIPLDFYIAGNGPNPPQDNFADVYAPNVLAYAESLRSTPEPGSIVLAILAALAIWLSRRRRSPTLGRAVP